MPDAERLSPEISWFPPRMGGAGASGPNQRRDCWKACPFQVSARGLVPSFKILKEAPRADLCSPSSPPAVAGYSKLCGRLPAQLPRRLGPAGPRFDPRLQPSAATLSIQAPPACHSARFAKLGSSRSKLCLWTSPSWAPVPPPPRSLSPPAAGPGVGSLHPLPSSAP